MRFAWPLFAVSVGVAWGIVFQKKVVEADVGHHRRHPQRIMLEAVESEDPLECELDKPDMDECYYHGRFPCQADFMEAFRDHYKHKHQGLIVTGQGGSATRAAQEVVEKVGSHDFGMLTNSSRDSLASRYAYLWAGDREVFALTTNFTFDANSFLDPQDANIHVGKQKQNQVCRTMRLLDDMIRRKGGKKPLRKGDTPSFEGMKPWALKSPYLRMLLPFFDAVVGRDGYKLVHVTRDVHHIHDMHTDDKVFDLIYQNVHPNGGVWEEVSSVFKNWDRPGRMESPDEIKLIGLEPFSKESMEDVLTEVATVAEEKYKNVTDQEMFMRKAKFAYVWGNVELGLMRSWKRERPMQYFHLSEKLMLNHGVKASRRLAKFLGVPNPSDEIIDAMQGVYLPEGPDDDHYNMMERIVGLKSMGKVREALVAFGYMSPDRAKAIDEAILAQEKGSL